MCSAGAPSCADNSSQERLRFMMLQTMREQKDSHGNAYPWDTTKEIPWQMTPYMWDGKKVKS